MYYTLKQVVFGLREEYLYNEKALNSLKKYITLTGDKELKEFDFYEYTRGNNGYIQLVLQERQSAIVRLLQLFQNAIIQQDKEKELHISRELNGNNNYLILPNNDSYKINDDVANDLYQSVDRLLNSDFVKKISNSYIKDGDKYSLKLSPERITVSTYPGHIEFPSAGIIYNAKQDQVVITGYEEALMYEQLMNIYNIKVDRDYFSEEQKDIIETSDAYNKDIRIVGNTLDRSSQFYDVIDEDDKTIVLQRNKKI